MRWTVSICCAIACSSAKAPPPEVVLEHVPAIERAEALAPALDGDVPPLVVVRESGERAVIDGPKAWHELASFDLRRGRKATQLPPPEPARPPPAVAASDAVMVPAREDLPARVVSIVGEVNRVAPRAVVVAAPRAKASALIEALASTSAAIAVRHGAEVRLLGLGFRAAGTPRDDAWAEVRIAPSSAELEAVPGTPVKLPRDPAQLVAAYRGLAGLRAYKPDAPVDLLVAPDVDVTTLVELVAAFHAAGVKSIGLGLLPDDKQSALRGRAIPRIAFRSSGELDSAQVQTALARQRRALWACYTAETAKAPALGGTLTLDYRVGPDGKMVSGEAKGVTLVGPCITELVAKLTLPAGPPAGAKVTTVFELRPNVWP